MPTYEHDKDYPFAAYITNLGKYNEGELVGEWVKFPTTPEELKQVFDRIGIGQKDDFGNPYEEWFITDYDCYVGNLYDKLGEYENLDELNYLASKLDEMDRGEYNQFLAAMEAGDHSGSIQEIINLTENLDCYDVYPDIEDYDDLGRYYIDELDAMQVPEHLKNYIDYEAYGRDVALEEGGDFTEFGYVRDTGSHFYEYYDGERGSIPEEYRVMTFQDDIPEEELSEWAMDIAYDMDAFFRQNDPQYAAEHPKKHEAKEDIYESLMAGQIAALEERLDALGQTQDDYLPSEVEKFREASGHEAVLDTPPAVGKTPEQEQAEDRDERMLTASMELAGDSDLFFRQYDMEYAAMFPDDTVQQIALHEHLYRGDTSAIKTGLINAGREMDLSEETAPLIARLDAYEKEFGINTYMVYQLRRGDEMRDYRFEPLDAIRRNGLSVEPTHYELVYAAPFTPGETLETIYRDLNVDRPANFHGHSLSISDIVVLREYGKDTAHYCDRFGFSKVPEFLEPERAKEVALPTPDQMETGERVKTPRGSFSLTDMSRAQMEAAGYGLHHSSDDGKYLIMGNGTRAFAILAEQPEKDNPLRTAEMTLEDDYGMIDGVINNGRKGEELEKAKESDMKAEPEKKSSIRDRLEDAKRECADHKPPEKGRPGRDTPEHGSL